MPKENDKTGTISLQDKEYSEKFKIGFLRGLIDTDGTLKGYGRYVFNSISKDLTRDTSHILTEFNVNHKVRISKDSRKNCRDVYRPIINKEPSIHFSDLINPRHPKKKL